MTNNQHYFFRYFKTLKVPHSQDCNLGIKGKDIDIKRNFETGWHLTDIALSVSRNGHVSSVISTSDVSESYPGKIFFSLIH